MTRKTAYFITPEAHCLVEESARIVVRPLLDVVESAEGLFVYCNLPGVAHADLELTVDKNELFVRGPTSFSCLPGKVHALEYGDVLYETRLALPLAVDAARIEASMRDGVLTVFLPFPRKSAQRIPVIKG